MSVYVDDAKNEFRGNYNPTDRMRNKFVMCQMSADSLVELHEMAHKLGLKETWFQAKSIPHYDIAQSKRKQAVKLGAIEVTTVELVKWGMQWRGWRKSGVSSVKPMEQTDD